MFLYFAALLFVARQTSYQDWLACIGISYLSSVFNFKDLFYNEIFLFSIIVIVKIFFNAKNISCFNQLTEIPIYSWTIQPTCMESCQWYIIFLIVQFSFVFSEEFIREKFILKLTRQPITPRYRRHCLTKIE